MLVINLLRIFITKSSGGGDGGGGGGRRLTLWVCGPRNVSYIQQTIGQQF